MAARNSSVLEHILFYCENIRNSMLRFGNDEKCFLNDIDYQNSICMSILQIGELTTQLSEEFKSATTEVDWRGLKYIRNICAHRYGTIDLNEIWNVATVDIPNIESFCKKQIHLLELLNQEASEPDEEPVI